MSERRLLHRVRGSHVYLGRIAALTPSLVRVYRIRDESNALLFGSAEPIQQTMQTLGLFRIVLATHFSPSSA